MDLYNVYEYDGPVMQFSKCIADRWKGITKAPSEAKARANLTYQFKCLTGKALTSRVTLPGKINLVHWKEKENVRAE